MPKIRRRNVPEAVLRHLYQRIYERNISKEQLLLFLEWLKEEPEVPSGPWFKRFPNMKVCGEGDLVKTFLTSQQIPFGQEIHPKKSSDAPSQIAPTPTTKPPAAPRRYSPPDPKANGPSMDM